MQNVSRAASSNLQLKIDLCYLDLLLVLDEGTNDANAVFDEVCHSGVGSKESP